MKKRLVLLLTALVASCLMSASSAQENAAKSIPETAVAAGNFKTLVAAVQAADLLDTLSGEGPFTVLAPSDEAFAKLPEGTVATLLKPENKAQLVAILKLHVAAGRLTSDMAEPGGQFPTVAGKPLDVAIDGDKIRVGNATVVKADIACSNGVIHVIDSVILPETKLGPASLVGKWSYTKGVKSGEKRTADDFEGQVVEITKDTWTLVGEGGKFVMDYAIDTQAKPNKIKFTITESPFGAGMSTGGLIKMEGDELVICYAATDGDAPAEFVSEAESGVHLFHLKKNK